MNRTRLAVGGVLVPLLCLLTTAGAQGQPPAPPRTAPAFMKVWMPTNDAKLEVDGTPTRSTGELRQFVSPPLPVGKRYYYELKVSFKQDGKAVNRAKTVTVEPGKETVVDLREPKTDESKKDTKSGGGSKSEPVPETKKEPKPISPKIEIKIPAPKSEPTPEPKKLKTEIEVPFVPTPQEVVEKMLQMAGVKEGDVVYDLGCGDGRIVITAVKKFHAKHGLGVDFDPKRVHESRDNAKAAGVTDKVEFKQGDVLKLTDKDLANVDVVTLYLLPSVNERLEPLLKKALKPGARVVSHDFDMKDWKASKTETMEVDGMSHTIYLWNVPKQ